MNRIRKIRIAVAAGVSLLAMPVFAQPTPEAREAPEAPVAVEHSPREEAEWDREMEMTPPPPGDFFEPGASPMLDPDAAPMLAPVPRGSLSEDQEKEATEFLRKDSPGIAAGLDELKKSAPEDYRRQVRSAYYDKRELDRLKLRHPERYESARREKGLDRQSRFLARRYPRATTDAEREQIRTELAGVLDQAFDLREARRKETIERLERELAELRQTSEKRQQNKSQIVTRRMEELLGRDDDLRW